MIKKSSGEGKHSQPKKKYQKRAPNQAVKGGMPQFALILGYRKSTCPRLIPYWGIQGERGLRRAVSRLPWGATWGLATILEEKKSKRNHGEGGKTFSKRQTAHKCHGREDPTFHSLHVRILGGGKRKRHKQAENFGERGGDNKVTMPPVYLQDKRPWDLENQGGESI